MSMGLFVRGKRVPVLVLLKKPNIRMLHVHLCVHVHVDTAMHMNVVSVR